MNTQFEKIVRQFTDDQLAEMFTAIVAERTRRRSESSKAAKRSARKKRAKERERMKAEKKRADVDDWSF